MIYFTSYVLELRLSASQLVFRQDFIFLDSIELDIYCIITDDILLVFLSLFARAVLDELFKRFPAAGWKA